MIGQPEPELVDTVLEALRVEGRPLYRAARIRNLCAERLNVHFGEEGLLWLALLVLKWEAKTPDVEAQASGIAGGIWKNFEPAIRSAQKNLPVGGNNRGGGVAE